MIILFYDCYRILSEVYKNGAYLKQAISGVEIEELNRAKTTKICYGVLDKDIELSYYLSKLCQKSPKPSIKILLKIAIYNIKYLNKKPYAVIDATVELAKKLGKGGNAGFINAVLRKFTAAEISMPKDKRQFLSVKYSYPVFAVDKLILDYGDEAEKIMAYDSENSFVRFKRLFDGETYLKERGYTYDKTPFDNLYSVQGMKLGGDFYSGIYTFQSIGSVAICDAVAETGDILDACSAPGGKSVLLAEKAKSVTSCEIHEHRLELVKSYAKRMGVNLTTVLGDSSVFNGDFKNRFDAVLCDVPCSGYGTLKNNPDIKLKNSDFDELNSLQFSILDNCSQYVKKGGSLYYSTCSIFRDENDRIIERFLKKHSDFKVEILVSPLQNISTEYGLQFLPHISYGAGFYICKLKR